ncbi:histidine phosphatase family protein [Lacrimispora sp. 210928-DFI.3.58]|uniref:histidine phosphatase family protein n=1 Tax=Lacrimispora sp. 210928-DFI.3.58 TaxID=2883214 RepID=UPI0015B51A10|nr:histidine phosphatase family protein [Lacrimispora sp. 210928-DFI.3.58]MCB7320643.1 histidine phosphatase family protein [Lacrimispora sp. 210928-DFI.3.58]
MRLYLIRHGRQCSRLCNVNVDLSEEGYRQAALVGERLFRQNIQAVYSSDLLRAVETAQAANLYWNVEHMVRPELREISFGDMEGLTDEEIARRFADFKAEQSRMEEDIPYPGGECAGDVIRRAEPVFMEMAASGFERVAVVTHGGVIRAMTAHYLGIPPAKWRLLGKDLENCSITELLWNEKQKRFTVERFNDYAHLEPYPELLRRSWTNASN